VDETSEHAQNLESSLAQAQASQPNLQALMAKKAAMNRPGGYKGNVDEAMLLQRQIEAAQPKPQASLPGVAVAGKVAGRVSAPMQEPGAWDNIMTNVKEIGQMFGLTPEDKQQAIGRRVMGRR
jgi:hypothetical protein